MRLDEGVLHGVPVLRIDTALCRAALSLHGGQLLAFAPQGEAEWLWLSPQTTQPPGAVRGGVPVCWPYFGRQEQPAGVPQHGFARSTRWELSSSALQADGSVALELELPAHASTPLRLRQSLRLGRTLRQALHTHNSGAQPLRYTQALHSYFRVGDAARVGLHGLDGLRYFDRYDGGEHAQHGDWDLHDPRDPGRSDRTYHRAGGDYVLQDPVLRRRLRIRSEGSASLVVWNPGAVGITAIADAPATGWRDFVCVEVSNAGEDVIELGPGQAHTLAQAVDSISLE